jgi:hypothetical protein
MIVATQKEAARELGVTQRQLRNWMAAPWWPANGRVADGYNVDAIRAARDAMGRKGSEQSRQAAALKLANDAEKLKQNRVKTQQVELELKQQQGDLFPRAGLELFVATFLTAVGDDLDQLPAIVAKDVPTKYRKPVQARLQQEFNDLRRKWRSDLEREARERDAAMPATEHGRNE